MDSSLVVNSKIRHFVAIKRPHIDNNNQVRHEIKMCSTKI